MPKVNVPQQDGQIVINRAGAGGVVYDVQAAQVDVQDVDLLSFLRDIPGSSVAGEAPAVEAAVTDTTKPSSKGNVPAPAPSE